MTHEFNAGAGDGLQFGSFFALMPGDNAATVALGAALDFPQDGPANGITRVGADSFNIPTIGTYEVSWQVSVNEPGQLQLRLNAAILLQTTAGRATGTSQITNTVVITTSVINSVLEVINPPGNAAALTITPIAGGTNSASAWLVIKQIG